MAALVQKGNVERSALPASFLQHQYKQIQIWLDWLFHHNVTIFQVDQLNNLEQKQGVEVKDYT